MESVESGTIRAMRIDWMTDRLGGSGLLWSLAQTEIGKEGEGLRVTLWGLFWGSADLFTVVLLLGSVAAAAAAVRCVMEVREGVILPRGSEETIRALAAEGRWEDVRKFVGEDGAFVSVVVRAAVRRGDAAAVGTSGHTSSASAGDVPFPTVNGEGARVAAPPPQSSGEPVARAEEGIREAAELAASEECARWFRLIEPLNVIGNLGPLVGLAGTVWGMIIAFASLGEAGGRAGPADLSLGISKALFHTLLGLVLAVPALSVYGFYRGVIDRLCTRAMGVSAELVELVVEGRA